ncbi:MAG: D-alanyl-D-alanine carboxypeptidase [Verrucomicrobiota bacterium]|nr:D-alanyl-D-alanine carboxypeptidase [Verrucomicrobiota bacterium]
MFARGLRVEVKGPVAMLMDAESGDVLYEKRGKEKIYPASVTKVATALFVLQEKRDWVERFITVSAEALRKRPSNGEGAPWWWYVDGSRMGLLEGEELRVIDLLHGVLLVSGNDASNAIAEGISCSIPRFMDELNAWLQKMGCNKTHFVNPHGCHHVDHWTTAYDLCLMMQEALKSELFCEIASQVSYARPKTNKQGKSVMKSGNRFLQEKSSVYYPKILAAKTGYHAAANYVLLAAAEDRGRRLIGCLAGCAENQDRYQGMIQMFEAAFQEERRERLLFDEGRTFARKVDGAKKELRAVLAKNLFFSYFPSQEPEIRLFLSWQVPDFPIEKGAFVGEVQAIDQKGRLVARGELRAQERVEATLLHRCKHLFNR